MRLSKKLGQIAICLGPNLRFFMRFMAALEYDNGFWAIGAVGVSTKSWPSIAWPEFSNSVDVDKKSGDATAYQSTECSGVGQDVATAVEFDPVDVATAAEFDLVDAAMHSLVELK